MASYVKLGLWVRSTSRARINCHQCQERLLLQPPLDWIINLINHRVIFGKLDYQGATKYVRT